MNLKVLVSYYVYKTQKSLNELLEVDGIDIMMDSGAYTAYSKNKTIDINEYIDFLKEAGDRLHSYFVLDVIGDPKATFNNYCKMLKGGLSPIPIFTLGDEYKMIDIYYKTSHVLGIGSLVGAPKSNLLSYLKRLKRYTKGRRIHLLGVGNPELIEFVRPFSCDSSSYTSMIRYGILKLYMGNGKFFDITKKSLRDHIPNRVRAKCLDYGVDINELKALRWNGATLEDHSNARFQLNARSWLAYANDLKRKFGTDFYIASGNTTTFKPIPYAYEFMKGKIDANA